jgi:serine/threonine-protein kinase
VQKRPQPGEACPEKSIQAMEQELGWLVDSNEAPFIAVEVTKGRGTSYETTAVFEDGPVIGELIEPHHKAPKGTRLEGHLWTTGDRIYGRYVRAILPGGRTVPICTELVESESEVGVPKQAGSKPGHAVGLQAAQTRNVSWWR